LFLRETVFLDKALVGARGLKGTKVRSLKVFDQGGLEGCLVRELSDKDGNLMQAGSLCCTPATLTADDLVAAIVDTTNQNRLEDAVFPNGLRELLESDFVKVASRLGTVRNHLFDFCCTACFASGLGNGGQESV